MASHNTTLFDCIKNRNGDHDTKSQWKPTPQLLSKQDKVYNGPRDILFHEN